MKSFDMKVFNKKTLTFSCFLIIIVTNTAIVTIFIIILTLF